ncbi:AhpC/TSA family protein [Pedobacter sp. MC2016-14]|uniref:TlpA disulfide reductase family protein n=1 Tax=Pedobacter sp. MC2016-14 TaxID=2897327 RepID=UPI001E595858|nr:TlpA disulfide reductase family protein [Pedobacter sp. MC2016-14]MCD0489860.1 AhpC/TSA family protein [Pedobacter sp. MC2016-14]
MKSYHIILLTLLWTGAYAQEKGKPTFSVSGKILNAANVQLYLAEEKTVPGLMYKDSTFTDGAGHFSFSGTLVEPRLFNLRIKGKNRAAEIVKLFVGPNVTMALSGNADSLWRAKINGSREQELFESFASLYNKELSDFTSKAYKPYFAAKERKDSVAMLREGGIADRKVVDKFSDLVVAFVREHPSNAMSLELIEMVLKYNRIATADSLMRMVEKTPAGGYAMGKKIRENLNVLLRLKTGSMAPDFSQPDASGQSVNLMSLRGKYVLVDFWASWCAPCRAENPHLLKAYNKYKDDNFTVLSVSLDKDKRLWLKAVKEDQLPWIQLSDLKGFDNSAGKLYGITSVPSSFLIDPSGRIIALNLRGKALEEALEQEFNKKRK